MALLALNGIGVVAADFVLPISRAWHIDMTVGTSDPSKVSGAVALSIKAGALVMNGTAEVDDAFNDTVRVRVVAGAGGLGKTVTAKYYQQALVRTVLADLLGAGGETLSTTADAGVLATPLSSWTVMKMGVADAIGLLMDAVGASWRMLADGTFWCGQETWQDSGLTYNLEQADRAHAQLVITLEAPLLLPGVSLGGQNVSYVETHVDHKTVKSKVWLATSSSGDRMRDPFVNMVGNALPDLDYLGSYRCKVTAQSGTHCDLLADDPRLPALGFKGVLLLVGMPGVSVTFAPGAFVRLWFDGGNPGAPRCSLWEGGETVSAWSFGSAPDGVATKADLTAIIAALQAAVCGGSGSPISFTAAPLPTSYASNSFKVQR